MYAVNRRFNPMEPFNVTTITRLFDEVSLPIHRDELLEKYGDAPLQWAPDTPVLPLSAILASVKQETFDSVLQITAVLSEELKRRSPSITDTSGAR
jgi:hypothetical protein